MFSRHYAAAQPLRTHLALIALATLALLGLFAAAAVGESARADRLAAAQIHSDAATLADHLGEALRIEEDSPLWDCSTMGNRICGPGASEAPVWVPALGSAAPVR